MEIKLCKSETDIAKCWQVLFELRPHLLAVEFVPTITEMISEGYQLAFIEEDGKAVAAIGYRYLQYLYNGKHIYIDDLSTLPAARGKGYAGKLLDFVEAEARAKGYTAVTLDSGHHRYDAHRLYLNKGFKIVAHHFSKTLK
jgi:GNAT superfamily N-acetyltransferase